MRYLVYLVSAFLAVNLACANVLINEMLPSPASDWNGNGHISGMDDEFIELYNSGNQSVDVSGYVLKDTVFRSTPGEYALPEGSVIGPGEFLVIFVSTSGVFQGNDGDAIELYDRSGSLVDEKRYDTSTEDVSLARIPDGGEWKNSTAPTPGKPNRLTA
ncbi:MAG: hypothetical protein A4E45_01359 [Methanosaeta sp. PtaB.Bin039]|nr:MAG: hypothetical protein A4E45_01359 [Methanosaeta sp. PtaB.Bin039]OPY44645.1 MAG: hypothetical protein A4E47_01498 [Methanosaeta sp. PtaU1.Bin028]